MNQKPIFSLSNLTTALNRTFKRGQRVLKTISPKTHCEQKSIHDYYCDAEKPFINF